MRYLFIIAFFTCLTQGITQEKNYKYAIALNIPPIIGHTIDLKFEYDWKPHWTFQLGAGYMINNKIKGSWKQVDDGTSNWNNSGFFASLGARFNTRKEINKNTFFVGTKLINGYFDQQAYDDEYDIPINSTGYFIAAGIETGVTIKIFERLKSDIGFQYSPVIYSDSQASNFYSILPGTGSVSSLQGILTVKYIFGTRE